GDDPGRTARLAVAGRVGTLAARPAVVAALLDPVGLVHRAVAELLLPQVPVRVEGEPLRVAVPEAPDGVVERVVRRNRAVRVDPQDLPVEVAQVLRVGAAVRVTGGDEQEPA